MSTTDRIADASARTIYVVGSLNLDTTLAVHRHPAAGETVTSSARATGVGGKGGNQAIAAARAGADVVMVGAVGTDAEGLAIRGDLTDAGVDIAGVSSESGASGAAIVLVDDEGENVIVVSPGANAALTHATIDLALRSVTSNDTIVLQNEISAAITAHAAHVGRAAGATVVWNAAPAPADRSEIPAAVDILVVNEGELHAVARQIGAARADVAATIDAVSDELGVDVVCTRGSSGATARVDGVRHDVVAPAVRAVDTTAAGDTFLGYFAASAHLAIDERLRMAAAAGAAAVTRPGAAASIPAPADVLALLTA